MNIRLRQLRVFKAIVEAGTVSEAATSLHLTQSSVSKLLAGLEEQIGFLLFDRIGRRLKLSSQGLLFFNQIDSALEAIEGVHTAARDIRENQGKRLRIAAIGPMLHGQLVPGALRRFSQENPDFRFSVEMKTRMEIEEWIAQRHSDIGFTLLPVDVAQLNFRALVSTTAVVVVPSGHPLAHRKVLRPADIADAHLVMPRTGARVRGLVEASFVEAGVNLQVQTLVTSAIEAVHLVAQGLGVSVLDPLTATGADPSKIRQIQWQPTVKLVYGVVWPKSRVLSAPETRIIELAEEIALRLTHGFRAAD